ncbi:hypothetical protein JHW45_02640 [Paracoccus stylophorae]|uniref:DUF2268 domain-containing protein n=1 Tax=Paracoccus stylophorae TaxID=659350 RepID=A0ABY7SWW3_9RHOB|nr:DUF2268 domain-containing putative Zn-dependent protease [Paracoccus stylophorae]WCR11320.1 hypothetical protein JHW45_02640 [Paracoccus stylophorae]
MTIWSIHLLNARHALTRVLPEIRAAAREAVARVRDHAELPDFDLVVKSVQGGLPDWGVGGTAPAPGLIEVTLNPDRFDAALMVRTLVHQMHHLIRWDGPGYGRSLGDALVSEGLAGHFVVQVLGGKPDPWDAVTPPPGLARSAMNEWARLDYDHDRWFAGKGDIRKWAGHGLGHRLVARHLTQQEPADAVTLALVKADAFRPTMRQLVATETSAGQDAPQDPVQEATPETADQQDESTQTGAADKNDRMQDRAG